MVARAGGAGGYLHWVKYNKRKQPMPIAIVIGAAPVVMFTGAQKLDVDLDELGVAGGLAGRPVPIAKCVTIDLDVPADAEIVIEGLIDPEKLEPEAPFGESNGYVALEAFNMPMQVTAITHKRKPVFASIISQVTPSESSLVKKVAYEPLYLAHLKDALAIRGVRRVVMHEPLTNLRPVVFVQYAAGTPRTEVWRGLHGAASLQANVGKVVIGVSEDIDPDNLDAVFWAIGYRCNPVEDVHILPYHGGVQGSQYSGGRPDSKLLIDATLKGPMAPLALPKTGIHGTRAGAVGEARPAADHASSRRGTATRSAIGSTGGTPGPRARRPGRGRRPAKRRSPASAPASSRKLPRARCKNKGRETSGMKPPPFAYHDPTTSMRRPICSAGSTTPCRSRAGSR